MCFAEVGQGAQRIRQFFEQAHGTDPFFHARNIPLDALSAVWHPTRCWTPAVQARACAPCIVFLDELDAVGDNLTDTDFTLCRSSPFLPFTALSSLLPSFPSLPLPFPLLLSIASNGQLHVRSTAGIVVSDSLGFILEVWTVPPSFLVERNSRVSRIS